MSSWVRDTPVLSPPKKAGEFTRLPKELPNEVNVIEEVLPYPSPSRLFLPGSGLRMVDESTKTRDQAEPKTYKPVPTDNSDMRIFENPSNIKPRKQNKNFLPKNPEPFVPLTANYNSKNDAINVEPISVVKTFDNPSNVKPRGKPIQSKYEPQESKPKPKSKNQDSQGNQSVTKSVQLKAVSQLEAPANPQVTIVIPLNEGDEFLEEALQSVKRQTYDEWLGMIGVSGHSGEVTFAKATEIVNNLGLNKRFKVINLPDVKGAANTINHMVGQATTPLIAHLDADDLWLSKKLEFQMTVLEQDESIGIVGTMCRYFGDSNDFKILPPGLLNVDDFKKNNPLIQSSILMKRENAIFTNEFVMYDYDCWFRNVKNGVKVFNVNNILVLHRIHSKSFFNSSGKQDSDAIKQKYSL
jgi:hypothetical protein